MSECPMLSARSLPTDGTPLEPSPTLAVWRQEGAATPLAYPDGHDGLIVTRHEAAREFLADPRFTLTVPRLPHPSAADETAGSIDASVEASLAAANLLGLDGDQHLRMRRAVLTQFSLGEVRAREKHVREIVSRQLRQLLEGPEPCELLEHYATPISVSVHCAVLGIPPELQSEFVAVMVTGPASLQDHFDFVRKVLDAKKKALAHDVVSHLMRGEWTQVEREGLLRVLMTSGRETVAYMVCTAMTALLTHPTQLEALRHRPELMGTAIEEFLRVGAPFVTLFPRTALEEVEVAGVAVPAGTTVAVSPVAANRDEKRFENADVFDIGRDAAGHLGFGYGPHACIGQQLARLEIREAVGQLIAAAPNLRLVHADQLEPLPFANPVATYETGRVIVAWS